MENAALPGRKEKPKASDVLVLRGLGAEVTEKDIHSVLLERGISDRLVYVRIVKDRANARSMGIALLKFASEDAATLVLETSGMFEVCNYPVWLEYGFEPSERIWMCDACGIKNQLSASLCHRCKRRRASSCAEGNAEALQCNFSLQSSANNGAFDMSPFPTRFLLLRGLLPEWTAAYIFEELQKRFNDLLRVRLVVSRENVPASRGFAFAELAHPNQAKMALQSLTEAGSIKLDGQTVLLGFGRDLDTLSALSTEPFSQYWDPACAFQSFPHGSEPRSFAESACFQETDLHPIAESLSVAETMVQPVRPSKEVYRKLKHWSEKASKGEEVSIEETPPLQANPQSASSVFLDRLSNFCCLCKLKFDTTAELIKHAKESELHSCNFDEYQRALDEQSISRDRAADRRAAFGDDEDESCAGSLSARQPKISKKGQQKPLPSQEASVGAQLLKKMGWVEGGGLGAKMDGAVEPFQAITSDRSRAGLGSANLVPASAVAQDSYAKRVKTLTERRYRDLQQERHNPVVDLNTGTILQRGLASAEAVDCLLKKLECMPLTHNTVRFPIASSVSGFPREAKSPGWVWLRAVLKAPVGLLVALFSEYKSTHDEELAFKLLLLASDWLHTNRCENVLDYIAHGDFKDLQFTATEGCVFLKLPRPAKAAESTAELLVHEDVDETGKVRGTLRMHCPVSHIRLQLSPVQSSAQNAELNGGVWENDQIAWMRVDASGTILWRPWLLEYCLLSHRPLVELDYVEASNSIRLNSCLPTRAIALGIGIKVGCSDAAMAVHRARPHPDNLSQQLKLESGNVFVWHISSMDALSKYSLLLPPGVHVSELQLSCAIKGALASERYILSYEIGGPPSTLRVTYTTAVFIEKTFR